MGINRVKAGQDFKREADDETVGRIRQPDAKDAAKAIKESVIMDDIAPRIGSIPQKRRMYRRTE